MTQERSLQSIGRRTSDAGAQDHVIAIRKSDLVEALLREGRLAEGAQQDGFRDICGAIGAILHQEYFAELERLRGDYFYFNPEIEPHAALDRAALEAAYVSLIGSLTAVLAEANFVELTHAEVEAAHRSRPALRVDTVAPLEDFREVRFFRRGHHEETIETGDWPVFRRRSVPVIVYDEVVLLAALKPADRISERERRRLARGHLRPGSVLIKSFHNIASIDLNSLFPNVRVVLSLRDKLLLSGPALAGGVPILIKLASTITILFLVIGFYFGLSRSVKQEEMAEALAALSGLVALGSFIARQWLRYQRQSLKYQKEITEKVYFRNVNNNSGIFDAMIAAAEDQESKEAILAFYFLLTAGGPAEASRIKSGIETWLAQTFGINVAFKIEDALAKLNRVGLAFKDDGGWSVPPLERARDNLGRVWGDLLQAR
ncbi:MAG TPA: TMEM143 family protein [Xanthobacteraceae bacterium]|nr:TMEM143 family protein [Xanthobacteraceae bacterium]